jgi:hypothetical protein
VAGDGSSAGLRGTEGGAGPGAVHREQTRSHTEEKRRARRSRPSCARHGHELNI